jgi:UDP-glucose 4-epimerase
MPDRRRAVVLGGTGFIGAHLVQALVEEGWYVTLLSRRAVPLNVRTWHSGQVDYLVGDLADLALLDSALRGSDTCIHLVHGSVPGDLVVDHSAEILATLIPTVKLLSMLAARRIRHLVYVSSGGTVYGQAVSLPIAEDHPTHPISGYGVAKLAIEKYVELFAETRGLNAAILRPSNVYGPGQRLDRMQGAVGIFLSRILLGQPIQIWGDGSVIRDYLYVMDLVRAMLMVMADVAPGVWNVGTGVGTSIRDVVVLLEEATRLTAAIDYAPARRYDVSSNVLDASRLRCAFGWTPTVDLRQGIQRMLAASHGLRGAAECLVGAGPGTSRGELGRTGFAAHAKFRP